MEDGGRRDGKGRTDEGKMIMDGGWMENSWRMNGGQAREGWMSGWRMDG